MKGKSVPARWDVGQLAGQCGKVYTGVRIVLSVKWNAGILAQDQGWF